MQLKKIVGGRWLFGGHWRKLLAGMVIAVLLLPVPAFGLGLLNFDGPWTVLQAKSSGGADLPSVPGLDGITPANGNNLTPDTLFIIMGKSFAPMGSSSQVTVQNSFSITSNGSGGALANITHFFTTALQRAGIDVQIQLSQINTGKQFTIPDYSYKKTNTSGTASFGGPVTTTPFFLPVGGPKSYRITININYSKDDTGFWINSGHTFTFSAS